MVILARKKWCMRVADPDVCSYGGPQGPLHGDLPACGNFVRFPLKNNHFYSKMTIRRSKSPSSTQVKSTSQTENTPDPADLTFYPPKSIIKNCQNLSKSIAEDQKWNRNTYLRMENERFLHGRKSIDLVANQRFAQLRASLFANLRFALRLGSTTLA